MSSKKPGLGATASTNDMKNRSKTPISMTNGSSNASATLKKSLSSTTPFDNDKKLKYVVEKIKSKLNSNNNSAGNSTNIAAATTTNSVEAASSVIATKEAPASTMSSSQSQNYEPVRRILFVNEDLNAINRIESQSENSVQLDEGTNSKQPQQPKISSDIEINTNLTTNRNTSKEEFIVKDSLKKKPMTTTCSVVNNTTQNSNRCK